MKTILVVDDERDIVDLVKYNLVKEGYTVLTAFDGKQALELANQQPALILLDIMMPVFNGIEVLKQLKKNNQTNTIPVIFLTAKSSDLDEVLGLELGADDYIVKPISIPKLIARVKNVLRKHEMPRQQTPESIVIGAIEIFPSQHRVTVEGKQVFFPKKEFEVLHYLASHAGEVVNREKLLNMVWGSDVQVVDRTIDVHIRKIREKLHTHAGYIETFKGIGYKMRDQE